MSLRISICLIVACFVAVLVAALVFTGHVREESLRDQLSRSFAAGNQALWTKIVETGVQRMRGHRIIIEEDAELRAALSDGNRDQIEAASSALLQSLRATGDVARLDIISPTEEVLYSSAHAFTPAAAASQSAVHRMIEEGWTGSGVAIDAERNVTLSLGGPLYDEVGEVLGAAIYSTEILRSLEELKAGTGAEILIVNRRGRLLVGTEPEIWSAVRGEAELAEDSSQVVRAGDDVYSLTTYSLRADLGNLVAKLVSVQDVGAAYAEQTRVERITVASISGFLLLLLVGLSFYLHRALSPLTDGVEVLHALSRGDTRADVKVGGEAGSDELARIARAVNTFRAQTLAVHRHRRLQERRRRQQERFIRSEMNRLVATLDETARSDILEDLAEIEAGTREAQDKSAGQGGDAGHAGDLQIMGLAFHKMIDRVSSQQTRLTQLVTELQEALQAKMSFLAIQEELRIAENVQRSFLPDESLETPRVEIRASMQAAKEVGGDFFDYFVIDENRICVVIADVAGKGVPAALFMAVARTLIRAAVTGLDDTPGNCLAVVNNLLADSSREQVFVTVFLGIYDQRDGTLVYANGGHNPPLLMAQGSVEELPLTGGVALAMFKDLSYEESRIRIPKGGKLFLFTDGVTESCDAEGKEFGDERLTARLMQCGTLSPNEIMEAVLRDIQAFVQDEPQFDDITMVVLSREAHGRTA